MLRVVVALVVSALLLVPSTGRAKCAMPRLTHQVITHPGDAIPAGGGILVGWTTDSDWDKPRTTDDPAAKGTWRLRRGKAAVKTRLEALAPGLAVYRPEKVRRGKQVYVLVGDAGATLGKFTFSGGASAVPAVAPGVTAVTTTTQPARIRGRHVTTTVTLDAAPPADAHALVVRVAGGAAIAWGPVVDRAATTITVFDDDGRCEVHPPGMRAVRDGEAIEAVWVDRFGRTSAASAAVTASATQAP